LEFQQQAMGILQRLFPGGHPNLDKSKHNMEILLSELKTKNAKLKSNN
jgi:hypothetical protein